MPLLLDDRVERPSPVLLRIVHHQVHEDWHEEAQDRGAISHLIPIYSTAPGRAAMHELVAET
jgi:hypothetical protein